MAFTGLQTSEEIKFKRRMVGCKTSEKMGDLTLHNTINGGHRVWAISSELIGTDTKV